MDGLAESFSRDVYLDAQGHVWVIHSDGTRLSRLDGYRITNFPHPVPQAPVSVNPHGQIWSLYPGGLQVFEGNAWVKYAVAEVDSPVTFLSLAQDEVLFLLPDYLIAFNIQAQKTQILKTATESCVGRFNDMLRARGGGLWLAGATGFARIQPEGESVTPQSVYQVYRLEPPGVRDFHALSAGWNGELFASAGISGASGEALLRWDGSGWRVMRTIAEPARKCWRGPDGQIWLWLKNGAIQVADPSGPIIPLEEEIFETVNDVEPEPEGGFWMATPQGLIRYASPTWQTPAPVAAVRETVSSIQEDGQGRLWFAAGNLLIFLDQDTWNTYPLPPGHRFPNYQTQAISPLSGGRIALHTLSENPRLLLFNPDTAQYEFVSHPGGGWIRPLGPRAGGAVWIQHGTGAEDAEFRLEIFDGREFRAYPEPDQPWNVGPIRSLLETAGGDLWIGGENGLGRYQAGQYRTFSAEDGFSGTGAFCLHEWEDGRIWVGARHRIHEFDGGAWKTVLSRVDSVRSLTAARDGSVWVASGTGLHRFWRGSWISITEEDGLASSRIYDVLEDRRGRLWAGTSRGIVLYHPDADRDPPETFLSNRETLHETAPCGDIVLAYYGIDKWKYTAQERLLYSCRIDGAAWTPFHPSASTAFSQLPRGPHVFEVRAMDRHGNIDPTPERLEFTVLPPWYATRDFLTVASCFTVVIVSLAGFLISRHVRLEKLVRQRTADLTRINQSLNLEIAERKQAEATLEKSQRLYRKAIEVADAVPYYRDYVNDRYEFVGDNIEKLTGYRREEFTPQVWRSIHRETLLRGEFAGLTLEEAVEKARGEKGTSWRADYRVMTKSGEERWLANAAIEVRDEQDRIIGSLGLLQDITARIRALDALRESEAKNQALLGAIPDLIVRLQGDGTFLACKYPKNQPSWTHAEDLTGRHVRDVLPPKAAAQVLGHLHATLHSGESRPFEFTMDHEDRQLTYEARFAAGGGGDVLAIVRDITERKRLEREILAITEIERKRIGDELHDDLCQFLTGLALQSKVLEEELAARDPSGAASAREVTRRVNRAISMARILAKGLHPVELEANGLMPALEELAANAEKMHGVSCRFQHHRGVFIGDTAAATHLYRISQEALNNAIKHGRAGRIVIRLDRVNGQTVLTVRDNGAGIPGRMENRAGMGLRIMEYRARMIDATLEIRRHPDGGTIVTCAFLTGPGGPPDRAMLIHQ